MPFSVTLADWKVPEPDLYVISFNFQGPKDEPLTQEQIGRLAVDAARLLNDANLKVEES